MKNLLLKIRQRREEKGYSQHYMACALEISQAAYSKLESGQTKMSLENFVTISRLLEYNFLDFGETVSRVAELEARLAAVEKKMGVYHGNA